MNVQAVKRLRAKLAEDESTYGLWVTLESPSITEMAVALGLDWVVVDAEHGHLDWKEIVDHVRAAVRSNTTVLVRIAESNAALVKRVLDIGADGIVVPWMETAEQLKQVVSFAHYPPNGIRGIGGERATGWGRCFAQHVEEAEENVMVVPIIESVTGAANIRELVEVPGVEAFYFGPADFSATAGFAGQWEGGDVAQQILAAKDVIKASGKQCGVIGINDDNLRQRREQGFRMIGFGLDSSMLLRGLTECLAAVGIERTMSTSFIPNDTKDNS